MAETFTADPTELGFFRDPAVPPRSSLTKALTITGSVDPTDAIDITKVGAAAWLTVPATCLHGVAFDVTIDTTELPPETVHRPLGRSETLQISHAGYTTLEVIVSLERSPGSFKP